MNETKVYAASVAPLDEEQLFSFFYQSVSERRREKIDAYQFLKDKKLSLAAEVLLSEALRRENIDYYVLLYTKSGKPYLLEQPLCVSLSHSEEMVFCAVSPDEVGCDVEKIKPVSPELAKRFFSPEEYERIAAAETEQARTELFFRLWTLKESFVKAIGSGLRLPFSQFSVNLGAECTVSHRLNQNRYYLQEYSLSEGYRFAACGLHPLFGKAEILSLEDLAR